MKAQASILCIFIVPLVHGFTNPSLTERHSLALHADTAAVEQYLQERCPIFLNLVFKKNQNVWKKLSDSPDFTLFSATDEAMKNLGEKKLSQLQDDRNGELAEQIAAFHCVGEVVSAEELYDSAGVITFGGTIEVGRSTTGGIFGIGGKEDGGVTIQGARVTESFSVGGGIVHEVDSLVSPDLLWRYLDQLRIPGSK